MNRYLIAVLLLLSSGIVLANGREPAPPLTREGVCGSALTGNTLTVRPGVTEVIPVARGHTNRIVTPFQQPNVTTMDKTATVKVTDRVVYFATEGEQPVSLFITPENSEAVALSVTLVPCGMPPRELELRLEGGRYPFTPVSTGQARPGEEQQPYVDALLRVMRALALEEIPQGFNLRRFGAGDPVPECSLAGIELRPAQVVEGHQLLIVIALARNVGAGVTELSETGCAGPRTAAVAAWPRVRLEAGQETELYVALRRQLPEDKAALTPRPSLVKR